MSTENRDARKLDGKTVAFYGIFTYVGLLWAGIGLFCAWTVLGFLFPDTFKARPSQSYAAPTYQSYSEPSYGSHATTPTRPSAPTPVPDAVLERLNNLYATLLAKRKDLDLNDTAAIEAFNKEAATYKEAVKVYHSVRAERLRREALLSQSYVPSTTPSPYAPESGYITPSVEEHYVPGYTRSDGTVVRGHYRTNPDGDRGNNYSTKGNINPHTGQSGTVRY